jgi:hypothetical protein
MNRTCEQKSVFYKNKPYYTVAIAHDVNYKASRKTPFNWPEHIEQIIQASKVPETTPIAVIIKQRKKANKTTLTTDETKASEYISDNEVETTSVSNSIENDTEFYRLLSKLYWCDKDEGSRSALIIPRVLTIDERRYILQNMDNVYIPQLMDALSSITAFDGLSNLQQKNMFAHIIGKGKSFNEGIQQNPDVSIYLIDQYHDLYTFLQC